MMDLADYNMDQTLRDSKLIQPEWSKKYSPNFEYMGGLKNFTAMDYDTLQWMVDHRFADPNEQQNDAPTIADFVAFLHDRPNFRAIGYVIDASRDDYRLSVEGVEGNGLTVTEMSAFAVFANGADEFDIDESNGYARAWWD